MVQHKDGKRAAGQGHPSRRDRVADRLESHSHLFNRTVLWEDRLNDDGRSVYLYAMAGIVWY